MHSKDERKEAFVEFMKIPSVTASEGELRAAEWLESRLQEAGIPHERVSGTETRPNILAKLSAGRPSGKPPLVLISHFDVVPAGDETLWAAPPFGAETLDGRIFARGALDTKQLTLMEFSAFLNLRERQAELTRDVLFLATLDEEAGSGAGMDLVKQKRPELFRSAVVLNEGGGFPLSVGGRNYLPLTVGEKAACGVKLRSTGDAGHAAAPGENQAIPKLAAALRNIFSQTETLPVGSRRTYDQMRGILETEEPDNPTAGMLCAYAKRNTVGMRNYRIGQRVNVLPGSAEAILEFRLLPGAKEEEIASFLRQCLAGTGAEYEILSFQQGFENDFESPDFQEIVRLLEQSCEKNGFRCTVLPMLALGRTDGRFFGCEKSMVFGCSPLLLQDSFDQVLKKVHGINESITEESFEFGSLVLDGLIRGVSC